METLDSNFRIDENELSFVWLQRYPVWAWCEVLLSEPEDFISPVDLATSSVAEFPTLFVKASFKNRGGHTFDGYVMYDTISDGLYCVNLFIQGRLFNFNYHLPDMAVLELGELEPFLPEQTAMFFPLTYECDIESVSGRKLTGQFDPFSRSQ